jgi:beta-xylosidase
MRVRIELLAAVLAFVAAACVPLGSPPDGWNGATLAYANDSPDPSVLLVGNTYYAFSTNAVLGACGFVQVPMMTSTDLRTWTPLCSALPHVGSWASDADPTSESTKTTWAPAVLQTGPSSFVMYYTAPRRNTTQQCIGRAVSSVPWGPYVDGASAPLACQPVSYWSIDPSPFRDRDGSLYLVWRRDLAAPGSSVSAARTMAAARTRSGYESLAAAGAVRITISAQPLSADGLSFATGSAPVELLASDQGGRNWESPVIEGPAMVVGPDGIYDLLYSGGDYKTAGYAEGYATCGTSFPTTPCTRGTVRNPWLTTESTGDSEAGPGGASVFTDVNGNLLVAYHAWNPSAVNQVPPGRELHIRKLTFAVS